MQHWHDVLELTSRRAPRAEKYACDLAANDKDGWDEICWLEENRYMLQALFAVSLALVIIKTGERARAVALYMRAARIVVCMR